MTEPWSGCMECGHDAHPYVGRRDVRCGVPTNNGDPSNGPEECECVQWPDVLAAYRDIETQAAHAATERAEGLARLLEQARSLLELMPRGTSGPQRTPIFGHCMIAHPEGVECIACKWLEHFAALAPVAPQEEHEPGANHEYDRPKCIVCGQLGSVVLSIEPQRAPSAPQEEPR